MSFSSGLAKTSGHKDFTHPATGKPLSDEERKQEIAKYEAFAKKYKGYRGKHAFPKTANTRHDRAFIKSRNAGKSVGKHLSKYRKDYFMGTAAAGSIGTAYGANRKKD